jgi:hypothetical protein
MIIYGRPCKDLIDVKDAPALMLEFGHQRFCPDCGGRGGTSTGKNVTIEVRPGMYMHETEIGFDICETCHGRGTQPFVSSN